MNRQDHELDRLLRAAAAAQPDSAADMPFGFDTRVLAQQAELQPALWSIARFLQRTALVALLVAISATAGAWWQASQRADSGDFFSDAYAIADSAIENGALR